MITPYNYSFPIGREFFTLRSTRHIQINCILVSTESTFSNYSTIFLYIIPPAMSFISSPADVSSEFHSDVAQRLVFTDEYPGILDVGFIAPSSSPVNESIQYSRYYHPYANIINREAWAAALTQASERMFTPTGAETAERLGWVLPASQREDECYGWCHTFKRSLPNRVEAELYIHTKFTVEIYHKSSM
mgnify:CR=1 FL=1